MSLAVDTSILNNPLFIFTTLFIILLLFLPYPCAALTTEEILILQIELKDRPLGERIAAWAEQFVGVPYDTDPVGMYVSEAKIVADDRVDCMYLIFRAVELAHSSTPEDAILIALDKRFHDRGIVSDGIVTNYATRFRYGEDMMYSGKWGRDITGEVGKTRMAYDSRRKRTLDYLTAKELLRHMDGLKSGDMLFFLKALSERTNLELIGHMGIVKTDERLTREHGSDHIYLIHAGGIKGRGGKVQKILLKEYLSRMPFIGIVITRFP